MSAVRALARRWLSAPARCSGTLDVDGPGREVLIRRDRYGIVHIEAASDADAWYAAGFCQGQDRAFQIETRVRLVRGTLAALVGPEGVAMDRFSLRIGFGSAGAAQLEALDAPAREVVEAFARGVTDGGSVGRRRRPVALALLAARPSAVTAADVLAMQGLMSFLIGSNWDGELARLMILTHDGPEALQALEPLRLAWHPAADQVAASASDVAERLAAELERFVDTSGTVGGSNAWAVAPSRTASGRPLLANDPHLSADLPPHWYLAHVRTPDWHAAGAQLVGTPGFVVGHNERVAWGVTAGFTANTELFVEELSPDRRAARHGEGWEPVTTRTVTVKVRGARPEPIECSQTPRGPLLTEAFGTEPVAVSFDAVWRHPRAMTGFLSSHRSADVGELYEHFRAWPGPALNLVAADVDGHIGWRLVGDVPLRDGISALLPAPGDRVDHWGDEMVAFEDMPHLEDPPSGYVASANNRPRGKPDGVYLGDDFLDGYRAARISELVGSRADWSVEATREVQLDRRTLVWSDVRDAVLAAAPPAGGAGERCRLALEVLRGWEGDETPDSAAATLFETFLAELGWRVAHSRAPNATDWATGRSAVALLSTSLWSGRRIETLVRLLREQPDGWFCRPWPVEVGDALALAVARLTDAAGADTTGWAWGRVRPARLAHPLGRFGPLGRLFDLGPFAWGGSGQTINAGGVNPSDVQANPGALASLRVTTEVGRWDTLRVALPGGQSGDVDSRHYDDLVPFWLTGDGVPIAWSRDEVAVATVATLRLVPAAPQRPARRVPPARRDAPCYNRGEDPTLKGCTRRWPSSKPSAGRSTRRTWA